MSTIVFFWTDAQTLLSFYFEVYGVYPKDFLLVVDIQDKVPKS